VPRDFLHGVEAALERGDAPATVEYLYRRSRLLPAARAALAQAERAWSADAAMPEVTPPWRWLPPRNGRERQETIWPDLAAVTELYLETSVTGAHDGAR
jgi:hypothetical protein